MIVFRYTLFYEHSINGLPVMRPLFQEFPAEEDTFTIDDQYLLGKWTDQIQASFKWGRSYCVVGILVIKPDVGIYTARSLREHLSDMPVS